MSLPVRSFSGFLANLDRQLSPKVLKIDDLGAPAGIFLRYFGTFSGSGGTGAFCYPSRAIFDFLGFQGTPES